MTWLIKIYLNMDWFARTALASEPGVINLKDLNPLGDCARFNCVITKISNALIIISIPLVSIMVLIGGFYILTAGGKEENFKTGRKIITYSVIGFAAVLVAKSITFLILDVLGTK